MFAADSVASRRGDQSSRALQDSTEQIASTLQLALVHEEDLVLSEAALLAHASSVSNLEFARWVAETRAFQRYPELVNLGFVSFVPASQLKAFAAHAVADPVGPLVRDGSFNVQPPGARPFYCLSAAQQVRSNTAAAPAEIDYCVGDTAAVSRVSRDSGRSSYLSVAIGTSQLFVVQMPVYVNGVVPASVAGRRAAFVGWAEMTVAPDLVLNRALAGHRGTVAMMRYHANSSTAAFCSGQVPSAASSASVELGNGWTVQSFSVLTASIGIAIGYGQTPGELLRDADMALSQAKDAGKKCYRIFGPETGNGLLRRYELEFDLRAALEGDQFRLVYQPIYHLDDLTMIGVEALLRWQHPTLGQTQPNEFIPLLESRGQIIEVGRWVLRQACTQTARWRERGNDLTVAVNVSGRQLDHDVIIDDVRQALEASGLEPAALTVEVTETALMRNIDATARRLRDLGDLGVQVAIDDFGTGYSSVAYLQRFPVDTLKIDRSFTDAISSSPESDALIHTLVQIGKVLGLKTLAEGVENARQLDHLRREQVNEVQGFLLSRPLDPETLETQFLVPGPAPADPPA